MNECNYSYSYLAISMLSQYNERARSANMRSLALARGALSAENHRLIRAHIGPFGTRNTLLVIVAEFHSPGTAS